MSIFGIACEKVSYWTSFIGPVSNSFMSRGDLLISRFVSLIWKLAHFYIAPLSLVISSFSLSRSIISLVYLIYLPWSIFIINVMNTWNGNRRHGDGIYWRLVIRLIMGIGNGINMNVVMLFLFLNLGCILNVIMMKYFVSSTIIVGNIIDIYILGLIAVIMNWCLYALLFGLGLLSFIFYAFLHRLELFLSIIGFLELFSTYFQSITLSNRLSINIFAGSLIVGIIMTGVIGSGSSVIIDHSIVGLILFLFSFSLLLIIFGFEIFNTCIQFLLFGILMMSYSI